MPELDGPEQNGPGQRGPAGFWRPAALSALGLQVLSLFLTAGYHFARAQTDAGDAEWLNAGHDLLTGILTLWWTMLLARLTLGRGLVLNSYLDRVRRALKYTFPLLTAFRGVLWGLTALALASGAASQANPVAVTAMMTIWGASIAASYMTFFWVVRWGELGPERAAPARRQLEDWLNLAAALSLGMTVINVVPIAGFSAAPSQTDQLIFGSTGLLDVAATLLALQAVRLTRLPEAEARSG
ncbi:hypothetical protein [Deinococcus sp. Marseille-Q6407]|uniref:hypothetical protein n=1 Tax=Deinococcus sp. Marseille-Q6407 TaxID=2969223 RepID=UPI0021C0D9A7|nr:hypothetical protein [Deinococcus sp. Marseille-Q6407]